MYVIDKNKFKRQLLGIERWRKSKHYGGIHNGRGTLKWVTGMGKTFAACILTKKVLKKSSKGEVLILVPRSDLKKQWENSIKSIIPNYSDRIKVETVQHYTFHQIVKSPILLIVDEIHEFYTSPRLDILRGRTCTYNYILGLTATFEEENGRHLIAGKYVPIVDVITENDAIKNGYISDYREFNLGIDLDEKEMYVYHKLSEIIESNINKFGGGENAFEIAIKCLVGDKHKKGFDYCIDLANKQGWYPGMELNNDKNIEINSLWNPNIIMGCAKKLMKATEARNKLLANSKTKIQTLLDIVTKFQNKKIITFSENTQFADEVTKLINDKLGSTDLLGNKQSDYAVVYHSNLESVLMPSKTGKMIKYGKTRLKKLAIDKIRTGEAKVINTAKALDVGFDVEDMDFCIITSGSSNFNQHFQRAGRVKRKSERGTVIIVNVFARGTKDIDVLLKRQKLVNKLKINWIDSVNDIKLDYLPKHLIKFDEMFRECLI